MIRESENLPAGTRLSAIEESGVRRYKLRLVYTIFLPFHRFCDAFSCKRFCPHSV